MGLRRISPNRLGVETLERLTVDLQKNIPVYEK